MPPASSDHKCGRVSIPTFPLFQCKQFVLSSYSMLWEAMRSPDNILTEIGTLLPYKRALCFETRKHWITVRAARCGARAVRTVIQDVIHLQTGKSDKSSISMNNDKCLDPPPYFDRSANNHMILTIYIWKGTLCLCKTCLHPTTSG